MIKDGIILIAGVGLLLVGGALLGREPIHLGNRGGYASLSAGMLSLGVILIVLAVARWRYRRLNA